MSIVLPGRPNSRLQALASGSWRGRHINAYITGTVITILDGTKTILQTIYDEEGDELLSIAIDDATGAIAVSTATIVRIYYPPKIAEDPLKWALHVSIDIPHPSAAGCALSWGREYELLIANSYLSLYNTKSRPTCIWQKQLPSEVKVAIISHDSAYIASISHHDRLPKVWRRLAYGTDEIRFDLTYIRHSIIVTHLKWREPFYTEQTNSNVLYTFSADSNVHVWIPTDTNDGQHWRQWGSINLNSALLQKPSSQHTWLTCILHGRDFTSAVESTIQQKDINPDDIDTDHLVAVANTTPEICLAIHTSGVLSAWALDNVSANTGEAARIFDIVRVESPTYQTLNGFLNSTNTNHTELHSYFDPTNCCLTFLIHDFDGRIGVFTGNVSDIFTPIARENRLTLQNIWTGHSAPIRKIIRDFSGRAIVSQTATGECVVWNHTHTDAKISTLGLNRHSVIPNSSSVLRICILRKGRFVVFLETRRVSLWDCRSAVAICLAQQSYEVEGSPLCLIALPRPRDSGSDKAFLAMVASDGCGIVLEATLPVHTNTSNSTSNATIEIFSFFQLPTPDGLSYVLPVDPAGNSPVVSGFLDIFARDVAISYSQNGRVEFWAAKVDVHRRSVDWLSTCFTETGMVNPSLASGSTLKKCALVNSARSQLTIWDIGGSRLEFDEEYTIRNSIQDLDWTSTPDSQSILAVGFQYSIIVLSQMRFDYLNKGPAWAKIREISIRDQTPHPIGDSTWLGDGHLVTGTGNQLFVYDRLVNNADTLIEDLRLPHRSGGSWDLYEAVQRFNGPLPVFHPQFLSQCILSGKLALVQNILATLYKTLRYLVPGEGVDNYLDIDISTFYTFQVPSIGKPSKSAMGFADNNTNQDEDTEVFSEAMSTSINEILTKIRIPQLSGHEQIQLLDIIECVALVERHRRSIDENGSRFMLFFRQHALRKGRTSEINLSWREINWAYHSNSQDILVSFVTKHTNGRMKWANARECGLFMWLSDINAVKAQFEVIARNEYADSASKSPVDCSLFYLALRKKTVLQGLWRMAGGNREQAATQRLLANDFEDPTWKKTALKNAYALLSKRRFQYAAAFFLLAGSLDDAVEVCLRQLKDLQLAVAISRVFGGDDNPVTQRILREEVLPLAATEGNRWLASWAFWMLGRKDMAVRSLITPVYELLETPGTPDLKSRLFLTDDPALVVLYSQLRHQTLQTLRGAAKISPNIEWEFVLHGARLYDRMGCDLLGLDLVRNWDFQSMLDTEFDFGRTRLTLLRRRSSIVVNDLPQVGLDIIGASSGSTVIRAPTMFHEPDAGSLLDSFGF